MNTISIIYTIWSEYISAFIIDIFVILSVIGLATILLNVTQLLQQKINNERYVAEININVYEEVIQLMDDLIATCFTDYLYMNGLIGMDYITEKDETEICRGVASMLHERISSSVVDKISLIYSRDMIDDIIAEKIYISVSSFVIETNSHKK